MFKTIQKIENLMFILVAISAIAVLAYRMTPREYTIRPDAGWTTFTTNDQQLGGQSVAVDESTKTEFSFRYDIRAGKVNPYASLVVLPEKEHQRFDFQWMESVSITARLVGKESEHFRLQVRNCDKEFFSPENNTSRRFNEVAFKLTNSPATKTISLDNFYVPGWWIEKMSVPLEKSLPMFDNVQSIQLVTGHLAEEGECRVIIDEIKFSGQWVSSHVFYRSMFGVWLCFGVFVALSQIVGLRKKLTRSETVELNLQRQTAELAQMATLDPLTQLFNRLGLRSHITLALRDLRQAGKAFCVIMFDIDNFKMLNDQNGHSHGDKVLQHVALIVTEVLTANDPVARWGGEEFLVVCRNSKVDRAINLAEQIRRRIEREAKITCSFGVCEVSGEAEFSDALDLVDQCLYLAKHSGKNCVKTTSTVSPLAAPVEEAITDSFS